MESRLDSVQLKLLRTTKFPPEFNKKVDTRKVELTIVKKWVGEEITKLLDDEIVVNYVHEIIEDKNNPFPNIKELQIYLTPQLGSKKAAEFSRQLWDLMLSAQDSPQGVPAALLEAKKQEIIREKRDREVAILKEKQVQQRQRQRQNSEQLSRVERRNSDDRDTEPLSQRGSRDNFRGNGRRNSQDYSDRRSDDRRSHGGGYKDRRTDDRHSDDRDYRSRDYNSRGRDSYSRNDYRDNEYSRGDSYRGSGRDKRRERSPLRNDTYIPSRSNRHRLSRSRSPYRREHVVEREYASKAEEKTVNSVEKPDMKDKTVEEPEESHKDDAEKKQNDAPINRSKFRGISSASSRSASEEVEKKKVKVWERPMVQITTIHPMAMEKLAGKKNKDEEGEEEEEFIDFEVDEEEVKKVEAFFAERDAAKCAASTSQ